ncbi:hypothetical protein D9758_005991 [Tetrapyrgos nigripes]|uniref:Major facilitator superfamily (MFS) profile domain-containing protein n=1 Tax=Tetrapyrgos nigripes TaxID=182062 RepID=A0A8H5D7Z8_9AGAR|nr:hypothetical protein D9758_005991 [Tetrapyrgos nigripes]
MQIDVSPFFCKNKFCQTLRPEQPSANGSSNTETWEAKDGLEYGSKCPSIQPGEKTEKPPSIALVTVEHETNGAPVTTNDARLNFSPRQRSVILAVVCFSGMVNPLSSLMYTPALPAIADALGVSISDVNLTVTTYLIFQGITPSIWGSLSDFYGRRVIYLVTLLITVGSSIGLCLTESFAVVLALRALHATGCSSTRALGVGVIRDIAPINVRGWYMGLYSAGVSVGTSFGPVFGGLLAQYAGWHGIFYFLLALSASSFLLIFLVLPETLHFVRSGRGWTPPRYVQPPLGLSWLADDDDGSSELREGSQSQLSPAHAPKLDFFGPLRIMKYPDAICAMIFTGITYTVWQDNMVATSTIYSSRYGLSEAKIGLTYLANGKGGLVIEHARLRSLSYNVPAFIILNLVYGWIFQAHIHVSVPIILSFLIGYFDSCILAPYSTLMVDLFEEAASTSSASMNLVRCLLGAVGSSTIDLMIRAMGIGWTFTTLSGIMTLGIPLAWYQYRFGYKGRARRLGDDRMQGSQAG